MGRLGQELAGGGLGALSGLALAVQARVNGQLGAALRSIEPGSGAFAGVLAATLSTVAGLVLLVLFVPVLPAGRRGLRRLRSALGGGELRWWQCLGGVCGALLVSTQGLVVAAIGVAVFTVAVVAGQVLSGLLVDRAGLGPREARPMTVGRTLGALLAVPAVAISVGNQFGHVDLLLLAVLPFAAGMGLAWQQAMNGLVTVRSGQWMVATLVNFVVACTALVLAAVALGLGTGLPDRLPGQWWLYSGGPLGVVLIGAAAAAVRLVGVLVVGLCSVAGQLVGALCLEIFVPAAATGSLVFPVVGTVLALAAVAVAGLSGRASSAKMEH